MLGRYKLRRCESILNVSPAFLVGRERKQRTNQGGTVVWAKIAGITAATAAKRVNERILTIARVFEQRV